MLEFDYTWNFAGSTGGGTAFNVEHTQAQQSVFLGQAGAGSTGTFSVQVGPSSVGPWYTEASTSLSTSAAATLRLTGPMGPWLRVYSNSTGVIVRGQGVGAV